MVATNCYRKTSVSDTVKNQTNNELLAVHQDYCDSLQEEAVKLHKAVINSGELLPPLDELIYVKIIFACQLYVENKEYDGIEQLFLSNNATLDLNEIENMLMESFLCRDCCKKPILEIELEHEKAWIIKVVAVEAHENPIGHSH